MRLKDVRLDVLVKKVFIVHIGLTKEWIFVLIFFLSRPTEETYFLKQISNTAFVIDFVIFSQKPLTN